MIHTVLVLNDLVSNFAITRLVRALRVGLHGFAGAWLRYSSSQWNSHYSSSRLALRPKRVWQGWAAFCPPRKNRTLQPVQLTVFRIIPRHRTFSAPLRRPAAPPCHRLTTHQGGIAKCCGASHQIAGIPAPRPSLRRARLPGRHPDG